MLTNAYKLYINNRSDLNLILTLYTGSLDTVPIQFVLNVATEETGIRTSSGVEEHVLITG